MMRSVFISGCLALASAIAPMSAWAQQPKPLRATLTATPAPVAPQMRADIMASRDILTLGDLVSGLPVGVAALPAFRAPALGETGTIQAARIAESLQAQGIETLNDGGNAQVVVTRAARRVGMTDIEAAIRTALEERYSVDARTLSLVLDNGAPNLVVEPELRGALQTQDIAYDARSRRVTATLMLPGSAVMRLKPVRITGQMVETVEVVVPLRNIARGDILQAGDVTIERRPKETGQTEALIEANGVVGKSARRALAAGQHLRANDLQRQEVVARNEVVTVTYEAPGLTLTMRGRAQEAGAQGDIVSVMNLQSKKVLQGTVLGPGRIAVNGAAAGRVAAAN